MWMWFCYCSYILILFCLFSMTCFHLLLNCISYIAIMLRTSLFLLRKICSFFSIVIFTFKYLYFEQILCCFSLVYTVIRLVCCCCSCYTNESEDPGFYSFHFVFINPRSLPKLGTASKAENTLNEV